MTVEISGKNLLLRPMTQKEYRALWRKYSPDPTSGESGFVYDEERIDALYESENERSDWCPVTGIFTKTDEIIGLIKLPRIVFSEKRCDIYVMLANESYRGKGLGTEALKLALKFARQELRLDRIYAEIPSGNARMRRVLEKCGFLNTKIARGYYKFGDRVEDKLDYVIRF